MFFLGLGMGIAVWSKGIWGFGLWMESVPGMMMVDLGVYGILLLASSLLVCGGWRMWWGDELLLMDGMDGVVGYEVGFLFSRILSKGGKHKRRNLHSVHMELSQLIVFTVCRLFTMTVSKVGFTVGLMLFILKG